MIDILSNLIDIECTLCDSMTDEHLDYRFILSFLTMRPSVYLAITNIILYEMA